MLLFTLLKPIHVRKWGKGKGEGHSPLIVIIPTSSPPPSPPYASTVLVGARGSDDTSPADVSAVVQKLADYLAANGY